MIVSSKSINAINSASDIAKEALGSLGAGLDDLPFETRAYEALLSTISGLMKADCSDLGQSCKSFVGLLTGKGKCFVDRCQLYSD